MRFSELESVIDNGDFITSDGYLKSASVGNYLYYKRDFLFHSGTWRDEEVNRLSRFSDSFKNLTLVLGHSDKKTSLSDLALLKLLGFGNVWGINTRPFGSFSKSLPLGLVNDCDDSPLHRILGNIDDLRKAHEGASFPEFFDNSIYANFSIHTNRQSRSQLLGVLRSLPKVTIETPNFSQKGHISYLTALRAHSFVICPEGNGVDTHRIWETLYMGGIPIVLGNPVIDSIIQGLPVLRLSSWRELTSTQILDDFWHRSTDTNAIHRFDKLRLSYWLSEISRAGQARITK